MPSTEKSDRTIGKGYKPNIPQSTVNHIEVQVREYEGSDQDTIAQMLNMPEGFGQDSEEDTGETAR